jgi:hypothetical protein
VEFAFAIENLILGIGKRLGLLTQRPSDCIILNGFRKLQYRDINIKNLTARLRRYYVE